MSSSRPIHLTSLLYLAAGFSSVLFETRWAEFFRDLLGATAPATSATLVAFFLGQAIGAAIAARGLPRARRPLLVYGVLEIGAAIGAAAVPGLLALASGWMPHQDSPLRESPALLATLRFAIAFAVTLPCTLCLGAGFPALGQALAHVRGTLHRSAPWLYGLHTVGAAAGAAAGAFWLPPKIGTFATYGVAFAVSLAVGAACVVLGGRAGAGPTQLVPEALEPSSPGAGRARPSSMGLAALSGLAAIAAQVLFVQAFAQVFDQSTHAFGAVLVVVLVALGIGSLIVSQIGGRVRLDRAHVPIAICSASALALVAFPRLLFVRTDGLHFVQTEAGTTAYIGQCLALVASTAGPALLAMSLLYPWVLRTSTRDLRDDHVAGRLLGRLSAANLLGAIVGALAAPYLVFPRFGPFLALPALAWIYGLAGWLAWRSADAPRSGALPALSGVALVAVVTFVAAPYEMPTTVVAPGETILFEDAAAAGQVAVVERGGERLLRIDNHYALGGTAERVHEERQGHLPLLLHAAPETVAFVGAASGISAGAAVVHPTRRIDLIELVPTVAEAARRFFGPWNRGIYDDPRAHVVLDDARNTLLSDGPAYDVLVADLFVPWRAGTTTLYSVEHFRAVKARLASGGLFCQWLPLYQLSPEDFDVVARSFASAFPGATIFRGDFYGGFPIVALIGFEDGGRPDPAVVERRIRALLRTDVHDRWLIDPVAFWSLYVGRLDGMTTEGRLNTLAHPYTGFRAGRPLSERLIGLAWSRRVDTLRRIDARAKDQFVAALDEASRRAFHAGDLLQLSGAAYHARREQEAARLLDRAASLLPAGVLREADDDPTALDIGLLR